MAQKTRKRTIVLTTTDKAQLYAEINKRRKGARSIAGISTNMDGSEFGFVRFWR